MGRGDRMGVPSNMALKAVVILAAIGFVYSQSHCSAFEDGTNDGRDCSCADRFFGGCVEPSTGAQLAVVSLEECQALCSDWSACEWFIFYQQQGEHLNCKLFGPDRESMADYLRSCTRVGGALRNEADVCLAELPDTICDNSNFCPGGCASCAGDRCNDFAETECWTSLTPTKTYFSIPHALGCQMAMTTYRSPSLNYFTFDQNSWICNGYRSGEGLCSKVVAAKNLDVQSCQTGTQRLH